MQKYLQAITFLLVIAVFSTVIGCASHQATSRAVEEQAAPAEQVAVVITEQGKFVIEFHSDSAPVAVENFKKLIAKRFYDYLTFHRRENTPDLNIIQGGDPEGNGMGGPGYTIIDEYKNPNQRPHLRGTVAMARTGAPNSAGSQFYICFKPTPLLDGQYTTFGQVIQGMDVVDKLRIGDVMKTVQLEAKSKYVKSE